MTVGCSSDDGKSRKGQSRTRLANPYHPDLIEKAGKALAKILAAGQENREMLLRVAFAHLDTV